MVIQKEQRQEKNHLPDSIVEAGMIEDKSANVCRASKSGFSSK